MTEKLEGKGVSQRHQPRQSLKAPPEKASAGGLLQPMGEENIKKLDKMYESTRFKDCDLNFLARIPADHPIYTDQFVVISRNNK